MIIKDAKLYDRAKWVAQILLPALGAFYFALAATWGLPAAEQVMGTIVSLDALLGVLLGISNKQYLDNGDNFDGDLFIQEGSGDLPDIHAAWNEHPDAFKDKDTVTLRTRKVDVEPKNKFQGR